GGDARTWARIGRTASATVSPLVRVRACTLAPLARTCARIMGCVRLVERRAGNYGDSRRKMGDSLCGLPVRNPPSWQSARLLMFGRQLGRPVTVTVTARSAVGRIGRRAGAAGWQSGPMEPGQGGSGPLAPRAAPKDGGLPRNSSE